MGNQSGGAPNQQLASLSFSWPPLSWELHLSSPVTFPSNMVLPVYGGRELFALFSWLPKPSKV